MLAKRLLPVFTSTGCLAFSSPCWTRSAGSSLRKGEGWQAMASPNFRNLWAGFIITNTGVQMQNEALLWLVRDLYTEPLYLGAVGLSFAIASLVLAGSSMFDFHPARTAVTIAFTVAGYRLT